MMNALPPTDPPVLFSTLIDNVNPIVPARIGEVLDGLDEGREIIRWNPGLWTAAGVRIGIALVLFLAQHKAIKKTYRSCNGIWRKAEQ
jgi:hypothetical protein